MILNKTKNIKNIKIKYKETTKLKLKTYRVIDKIKNNSIQIEISLNKINMN